MDNGYNHHYTDNDAGVHFHVKVGVYKIHVLPYTESNENFEVGIDGPIQLFTVQEYKNGIKIQNPTEFQFFTDPNWYGPALKLGDWPDYAFILTQDRDTYLRVNPYELTNYGVKFNHWNTNEDILNYNSFYISTSLTNLNSNFKDRIKDVRIQTNISGLPTTAQIIGFKDPWLVDRQIDENLGLQNRGQDEAQYYYYDYIDFAENDFQDYKGVFLYQGYPNWSPPYYKLEALSKPIEFDPPIGIRNCYFKNWSYDPNKIYFQPGGQGVVFKEDAATLTANYKGQGLSDEQNGYSSNSQRKFIIGSDNKLHYVYSDMGHVWYEISSDEGTTWQIANGGNYLDNGSGKLPSIDYAPWSDAVMIVYQEKNGSNSNIVVKRFINGEQTAQSIVTSVAQDYSINLNPVIAYSNNLTGIYAYYKLIVIYQNPNLGLYYRFGYYNYINGLIYWLTSSNLIYGSDGNSQNPTIVARKFEDGYSAQGDFYLTWQIIHK